MPPKMVKMETKTGRGRPKQPLEKRKVLSDEPHRGRKGEPDVPMGETLGMDPVPAEPPKPLSQYERECWDMIVATQKGEPSSRWIYRSDCSYLLGSCFLYGRAMELRDEINEHRANFGSHSDEEGRLNPKIALEASIYAKYLTSLSALGLVPTRRQVTLGKVAEKDGDDGLLS